MHKQSTPKSQHGFNIMELLVVVTIIGVIAAVAVPSYSNYVKKAKRADAVFALTDIANRMERFYVENNTYNFTATVAPDYGLDITASDDGLYAISFVTKTATTYTITASAISTKAQASDTDCAVFQITHTGVKSAKDSSDTASLDCW